MDDVALTTAGFYYSLAVPANGSLWTWGYNDYGQLGDGTTTNSLVPIQVMSEGSILRNTQNGATVSGLVRAYNPGSITTLKLMRGDEVEYTAAIEMESGHGQVTQTFAFPNVAPGEYALVITKPGHTSFTVQRITVGASDLDLALDSRPAVQTITLLCGDINGDNMINNADLAVLWLAANYNKSAAQANNQLCDLNGDGMINNADLAILWLAVNYNKGSVAVT
jgi:hypothetical protein